MRDARTLMAQWILAMATLGVASAYADEGTRMGIHAVAPIPTDAANLSVVQQAIIQDAHAVHFDLATSEAGEIVVFGETTLRAALSVARDKIHVDLTVDGIDSDALLAVLRETSTVNQVIVHAADEELLRTLHAKEPKLKIRAAAGIDSDQAMSLGASIVTLLPDDISSRAVSRVHEDGLAVWTDVGSDEGARDDAIYAETDYILTRDMSGTVRALREAGYYAARPLGRSWPVPAGKEVSLEGTRWKRGKHTLIFHEEPVMAVKGGIVDRFFRNGVKGEYSLSEDGHVKINVKGRKGSGTFDGEYLQTDGVECVRLES